MTQLWEADGADTPSTVSIAEQGTDGLHAWQTTRGLTTTSATEYDGSGGRTVTTTTPDGVKTIQIFAYDQLLSTTVKTAADVQIAASTFAYDPHGRLHASTDARNGTTSFAYYDDDQIHTVTTPDPDTGRSDDGYDAQVTTYTYDSAGRTDTVTQADGGIVHTTYWPTGATKRTWGSRTYPSEYAYYPQGRLKTLTTWQDFAGNTGQAVTTWNYNPQRGWLDNKHYDDGHGPAYTYTAAGRLHTRTWVRGTVTTYSYGAAGDLTGIDYADTTPDVSVAYDRDGRPETITDAAGSRTLGYHASGQLDTETYTSGLLNGLSLDRDFDADYRLTGVSSSNGSSVTAVTYGYDDASRLSTVTAGVNTATYAYVSNSNLIDTVTYKNSGTTRLTAARVYDHLNRLSSITSTPSASAALSYAYDYNSANQRVKATRENSDHWDYGYDALGQVISGKKYDSSSAVLAGHDFAWTFDDIGNRKTATTNGQATAYTATNLNQYSSRTVPGAIDVLGAASSSATVTVTLDGGTPQATTRHDELFFKQLAMDNTSAAQNASIAVTGVKNGAGPGGEDAVTTITKTSFLAQTPESYIYDDDGNLKTDARWTYTWDGENRLITMETSTAAVTAGAAKQKLEFAYDGQGRRISKKVSNWTGGTWVLASQILFLYDGWNMIAELNALSSNAAVRTYAWGVDLSGSMQGAGGIGGLIAATDSTSTRFAAMDGSGNVTAYVETASGITVASYEYGAFGETLVADGSASDALPFRFSSKYTDFETNLLYYGFRYYDSSDGRWLSRDPSEEEGSLNLTEFAANEPISTIDTDGRGPFRGGIVLKVNLPGLHIDGTFYTNGYTMGLLGLFGLQKDIHFGPEDFATHELQNSSILEVDRERIANRLDKYCKTSEKADEISVTLGNELAEISPFVYPIIFARDLVTNSTAAFVGSITTGTATVSKIDCCKRTANIHVDIKNDSGLKSASHLPPILFGPYGKSLFSNNPFGQSGPLHTFSQTFEWDEILEF